MPLYEITEEPTACRHDDDGYVEHAERNVWADDIAMYLRAEEAWPTGAAIRDAYHCADIAGAGFTEDDPTDFDD